MSTSGTRFTAGTPIPLRQDWDSSIYSFRHIPTQAIECSDRATLGHPDTDSMQYVSILSPGFSGSTLLSILLSSLPRSIGFGDTYFTPKNSIRDLCTCGKTFLECEPRQMITDSMRRKGVRDFSWETFSPIPRPAFWPLSSEAYWPLARAASLPLIRQIPPGLRRFLFSRFYSENRLFVESLEESSRYDFYFDGCKELNRLEFLRTAIPDIKVVHMVRHPGAILYHDQRSGVSMVENRLSHWSRYHRRARSFISRLGESNYMPVPYEGIVQKPETFAARVGEFLGISGWPAGDPSVIDRSKVHIIGNKMREKVERIIDYSNTWRQHIPEQDRSAADEVLATTEWAMRLYEDWGCDLAMN